MKQFNLLLGKKKKKQFEYEVHFSLLLVREWFLSLEPEFGKEKSGKRRKGRQKKRERMERQEADAHVTVHVSES